MKVKKHPVFSMPFARVYPLYVAKIEKKGRKKKELDEVICWLTGYTPRALKEQIKREIDFETFFHRVMPLRSHWIRV